MTIIIGEWARFLGEWTKVALLLAADRFEEEGAALVLGDAVAGETGGSREAVVEIADEEIVDIGDVEAVIAEFLVFLEADGVIHRLDGIAFGEVVLAEDEQAQAVPMPVKAAGGLGDLAFQDTAHGKGHPPVRELADAYVLTRS